MSHDALNAAAGRRRLSETRFGRGLLFLTIVWSIAGVSVVLLQGLPELFVQAVAIGLIPPDSTVDRNLPKDAARRCGKPGAGEANGQIAVDAATLQRARYSAFRLGRDFGLAAGIAFAGMGGKPEQIAQLLQPIPGQAIALGVPAPELPVIRHMSSALVEFAYDLSKDRQCTGYRLASRYSPAHDHIYRFGVVIGYAATYCVNDVCGVHGTEIRRYGQAAGIPEQLWLPMAHGSLADVPGATAREKTLRLLAILDEHIRTSR